MIPYYEVLPTTSPGAVRWFKFKASRKKQRISLAKLNAGKSKTYAAQCMASRRRARDAEVLRRRADHETLLLAHKTQKEARHATA